MNRKMRNHFQTLGDFTSNGSCNGSSTTVVFVTFCNDTGRGFARHQITNLRRHVCVKSALHLESGRTITTHVKIVALAALSTAMSILIWRLQPGHNLELRKSPTIVFPLYARLANGSRGGHDRRILTVDEFNPTFGLRLAHRPHDAKYSSYFNVLLASELCWMNADSLVL